MANKHGNFREIKIFFTLIIGLAAVIFCGYFLYLFHTIEFLPFFINLTLRALLLFAVIASITIMVIHIKSLE